jgi:hypothetical protein
MVTKTTRPRTPKRPPALAAGDRTEFERRRLEARVAGLCFLVLSEVCEVPTPPAAEPHRRAMLGEHFDRPRLTLGRHLRELAELADEWEYDDGDHHYLDADERPLPAEELFPELLAKRAGR